MTDRDRNPQAFRAIGQAVAVPPGGGFQSTALPAASACSVCTQNDSISPSPTCWTASNGSSSALVTASTPILCLPLERGEGRGSPLDGIAEFKVITSAVPAEFNQPSQVVVVSKSDAHQLYGMTLEFNRVAATAAKSYLAGALPKPQYIRNEFGGNLSGPVFIPKIYDGKSRSFFFFNYEGFRLIQASNVNSRMPTAAERSGNFTGIGRIFDPLTGLPFKFEDKLLSVCTTGERIKCWLSPILSVTPFTAANRRIPEASQRN